VRRLQRKRLWIRDELTSRRSEKAKKEGQRKKIGGLEAGGKKTAWLAKRGKKTHRGARKSPRNARKKNMEDKKRRKVGQSKGTKAPILECGKGGYVGSLHA